MRAPAQGAELARVLLNPKSVALIGASDDPVSASYRPLEFLRTKGFTGTVYPINTRRDVVRGEQAWPSIEALAEVPEHAYVMTPTRATVDAVRSCGELGVAVATVLSGGFAESGEEGAQREAELLRVTKETGIRVVGPNSLGIVNLRNGLLLTGNAYFKEDHLITGGTFIASQSGSLIGSLVSRGQARGVGFASVVSVGGETDLSIGEICKATLDDDEITSYLLFLETIRHGAALAEFALAAADRGKPIVAYKLGRSSVAAELAVSHTGALIGEDDIASLFLAECGIARVDSLEGLLSAVPLLKKLAIRPRHSGPGRVGVMTTTGGGAAMVVDQLGIRDVTVERPSKATFAALARANVQVEEATIVDLTLAGARPEIMNPALDVLLDAPEFDLVLAVAGSSARAYPQLTVEPAIAAASRHDQVLVSFLVPEAPRALEELSAAGIPVFQNPEACGDVVTAALSRRPPTLHPRAGEVTSDKTRTLDEAQSYELLSTLGISIAPYVLIRASELEANQAIELPLSFPVAVKVLSKDLPHKSDIGGVVLGVTDEEQLRAAAASVLRATSQHTASRRVLVQSMTPSIGEVLIGYRVDPQVGPVVLLAPGGTLAELLQDRSVRLAPITLEDASEMLDEVDSLRALRGFRGRPAGDTSALASALVALSQLASDPRVREAEINPLMVQEDGNGVVAVDGVVILDASFA